MRFLYILWATAVASVAADPPLFATYSVIWGGMGYENSGADTQYQPGKCDHPEGRIILTCAGSKMQIEDLVEEMNQHDCQVVEENRAECSSHGDFSQAWVTCPGYTKEELMLTAAMQETTTNCEAEGTSAANIVTLQTGCGVEWVDLDDQCSATKSGSDSEGYMCYDMADASCSVLPDVTCSASIDVVTVTSVGQNNSTCVHQPETTTEDPTTTVATLASTTSTVTTLASTTSTADTVAATTSTATTIGSSSRPVVSEDQCEDATSARTTCEVNAIVDTENMCTNDDAVDFEDLAICYRAINNCLETSKSICSMNHCCINEYIKEVNCRTGCQVDCEEMATSVTGAQEINGDQSSGDYDFYFPEACLDSSETENGAVALITADPPLFATYNVSWGGIRHENQPGKCEDPEGRMILTCAGSEMQIKDLIEEIDDHDCQLEENRAECSSQGDLSHAIVTCRGYTEKELMLTATLQETTTDCEEEGTYAGNFVTLSTGCVDQFVGLDFVALDFVHLDDQCSATKSGSDSEGYVCHNMADASCPAWWELWSDSTCTASIGALTVTSVGQNNSTCVHQFVAATEDPTTTAATVTASTSTAATIGSSSRPIVSEDQCEVQTSARATCGVNAIVDTQGLCTNSNAVDFEDLTICYKAIDNCLETAKSICSMKHCCLKEYIEEVNCRTGCQVDCKIMATSVTSAQKKNRDQSSGDYDFYFPEACLDSTGTENGALALVAADPPLFATYWVIWGGMGYENSGADALDKPGKCEDPEGRIILTCAGSELRIEDLIEEMNKHDCQFEENRAECSSQGDLSYAIATCLGYDEQELMLTATLQETTTNCEADGTSAANFVSLSTGCVDQFVGLDFVDLDDQCSATKTRTDSEGYMCYNMAGALCSVSPDVTCTATIGTVTVTSVGQNDSTCVHQSETTTEDPATTVATVASTAATVAATTSTGALSLVTADPPLYATYHVLWGGMGYENSGEDALYQPGKCDDPEGRIILTCAGSELRIDDSMEEMNKHDCQIEANRAECSSHDGMSSAWVTCLGYTKEKLFLTATLQETTTNCEAEGTSAANSVFLKTGCMDQLDFKFVDLDDQCSATKSGSENEGYMCYDKASASCSVWPDVTCTASIDVVTVTSVGQNNIMCVHKSKTTGEDPATTALCVNETSARATCGINATIDTQGMCTNNNAVDFEDLATCYRAIDNCFETAKSICSLKHCCLKEYINEINCRTGCQVDCEEMSTSVTSSQKKNRDQSSGDYDFYFPEACLDVQAEEEGQTELTQPARIEIENGAFVAQCMMTFGLLVMLLEVLI